MSSHGRARPCRTPGCSCQPVRCTTNLCAVRPACALYDQPVRCTTSLCDADGKTWTHTQPAFPQSFPTESSLPLRCTHHPWSRAVRTATDRPGCPDRWLPSAVHTSTVKRADTRIDFSLTHAMMAMKDHRLDKELVTRAIRSPSRTRRSKIPYRVLFEKDFSTHRKLVVVVEESADRLLVITAWIKQ